MRSARFATALVTLSLVLAGCGKRQDSVTVTSPAGTAPSAAVKSMLEYGKHYMELVVTLEGVKDEAAFQAALPKLEKTLKRLNEMNEESRGVQLSDEELAEVKRNNPAAGQGNPRERLLAARRRVVRDVPARIGQLDALLAKYGMSAMEAVDCLVAKKDIAVGVLVGDPEVLFEYKRRYYPEDEVPPRDTMVTVASLRGKFVIRPLKADQFVEKQDFVSVPKNAEVRGIRSLVHDDVAGVIVPGARVDVISIIKKDDKAETGVIANHVEVLVGFVDDDKRLFTVVLATTPEQADRIDAAGKVGRVTVVPSKSGEK